MAKRIKRAINRARHEAFMNEYRESGLVAQRKDRERRKREQYQKWKDTHEEKHSSKKPDEECPWCQDVIRAKKRRDAELDKAVQQNQAS